MKPRPPINRKRPKPRTRLVGWVTVEAKEFLTAAADANGLSYGAMLENVLRHCMACEDF